MTRGQLQDLVKDGGARLLTTWPTSSETAMEVYELGHGVLWMTSHRMNNRDCQAVRLAPELPSEQEIGEALKELSAQYPQMEMAISLYQSWDQRTAGGVKLKTYQSVDVRGTPTVRGISDWERRVEATGITLEIARKQFTESLAKRQAEQQEKADYAAWVAAGKPLVTKKPGDQQ